MNSCCKILVNDEKNMGEIFLLLLANAIDVAWMSMKLNLCTYIELLQISYWRQYNCFSENSRNPASSSLRVSILTHLLREPFPRFLKFCTTMPIVRPVKVFVLISWRQCTLKKSNTQRAATR